MQQELLDGDDQQLPLPPGSSSSAGNMTSEPRALSERAPYPTPPSSLHPQRLPTMTYPEGARLGRRSSVCCGEITGSKADDDGLDEHPTSVGTSYSVQLPVNKILASRSRRK
jgi:hypothetical protein